MQTLNNFITERLKLTKDTKINNYVYLIWPKYENFKLLKNISCSNNFYKIESKNGFCGYICDTNFFNNNIKKDWNFDEDGTDKSEILEIPKNEINDIIKSWENERDIRDVINKLKNEYKNIY